MSTSINQDFTNNLDFIKDCFDNNIPQDKSDYFTLITSPFKVLKLRNVLASNKFMTNLLAALETIELSKKDNDLYSLWQSDDLNSCPLKPVKKFIHVLTKEIGPFLSSVFNVEFNNKLTITASLYKSGDVLLCHDDKCEDRCIAFVYYLTGSEKSGGSFDMFCRDANGQPSEIVKSLHPEENSFVCFEVGDFTYHQVSEIIDDKFKRWSINGWFHSDRKLPQLIYEDPLPTLHQQTPLEGLVFLNQYLNDIYCTPSNLEEMKETFENESFILLKEMFSKELFEKCSNDLLTNTLDWKKVGPANRRSYYVADLNNLPDGVNNLVKLLISPIFISFLKNVTSLSLEPREGPKEPGSKFTFELIKWLPGCYTMATDNDVFFKKPGLDLYLFFCTQPLTQSKTSSGYVTYLDSAIEEDDDDDASDMDTGDKELITIEPEDNALSLVFRNDNTVRFTKYINHLVTKEYYSIYATYYEVECSDDEDDNKKQ